MAFLPRCVAALALTTLAGCGTAAAAPTVPVALPSPSVPGGPPIVVTLGDSVPAGTACDCTPFPDLYAGRLTPAGVSANESVPGYTSADVVKQLTDPTVRAAVSDASVVLVMAGANDLADAFDNDRTESAYQASAATVEKNVEAIVTAIRTVRTPAPPVLVLGYWNVVKDGAVGLAEYGAAGAKSAVAATMDCNAALRAAAAASGARYVTTTPVFDGRRRDQDPTNLLASDGDHPNAAGHQAIADTVYAAEPRP